MLAAMNTLFAQVVAAPRPASPDRARPPTARVFVRDLVLPAVVGIYAHEKTAPQRLRVGLDLEVLDRVGARRDDIADVVSYEDAINTVRALVAEGHVNLVETLAERIAARLLEDARVLSATVRLEKLDAFPDAGSVGIEITRVRG
ncbi:MAG TPA: dihydroneopterin aldolase [Azospirillaceae bacterium]|nr:dihydroneopterin aldolase [Azospirillaceae bacterium]